ncbi:TPA: hypothetical protein KE181_002713 [Escherichia coli]|nr:tail protein [Escherichia phage vB_EcoS_SA80RD]HBC8488016.1 hypothetical protein [Escherichia coli]
MLTWPEELRPSEMEWYLVSNAVEFTSPFNGASQTVSYPGSRWEATLTFSNLNDWQSRKLESTLAKLDGKAGRIMLQDFGRWGRPPMGSPVVNGANNTGTTLSTKGWTPDRKVLWEGDYIAVNNELKLITEDAWSDSSGNVILNIAPMLRSIPPNGAKIETQKPQGSFRLAENTNGVKRQPAFNNSFTLKFSEAF